MGGVREGLAGDLGHLEWNPGGRTGGPWHKSPEGWTNGQPGGGRRTARATQAAARLTGATHSREDRARPAPARAPPQGGQVNGGLHVAWARQGDTNARRAEADSQIPEDAARLGLGETDRQTQKGDRESSSSVGKTERGREQSAQFSTAGHMEGTWAKATDTLSGDEVI